MNRSLFSRCSIIPTLAVLALGLLGVAPAHADPKIYERTLRSTAWVVIPTSNDKISWGTGVLVDARRKWLITNLHLVQDQTQLTVYFPATRSGQAVSDPAYYLNARGRLGIAGEVIGTDRKRDLAMVQLASVSNGALELPLAAYSPRPGETVHAIGNSGVSEGALWRYSIGAVRQVYPARYQSTNPKGDVVGEVNARVVETQLPTNSGDSGGPVVNERGELVAVTQGESASKRLVTASIDVTEVRAFMRNVISLKEPVVKKDRPTRTAGK